MQLCVPRSPRPSLSLSLCVCERAGRARACVCLNAKRLAQVGQLSRDVSLLLHGWQQRTASARGSMQRAQGTARVPAPDSIYAIFVCRICM